MKQPMQQMKSDLDQVLDLLGRGSFFSFTPEETRSLIAEGEDLKRKLDLIESSFLTVGLLGGTGVGKSTLMNGLAGSEIASTSHRRPHTDHVLIYRHVEANPLPTLPLTDVPWREILHQGDAIRHILLCDLPDFDSLVGEHRKRVVEFLEHLDILVWVTSPEKYADARFYEFLEGVPKARQNFYFVLNKVDLLFEGETVQKAYEQLEGIVKGLVEHIRESGVSEPLLYPLSAKGALDPASVTPWNQFGAFRQQVFQQRDMKQISDIKSANLDVELQQLLSSLQQELVNLEVFEQILASSMTELDAQRSQWTQAGDDAIDYWLTKHIQQELLNRQGNPSRLVGPGYGIAVVFEGWRQRFTKGDRISSELSRFSLPEDIAVSFRRRLEWLEERLHRRILVQNLPASFRERVREMMDVGRSFEDLEERFSYVMALHMEKPPLPSFWGFKTVQYLIYALLLALFLLAIGGEAPWREVIKTPGWDSALRLFLSGTHTLFSGKGFAALGSYAVLNLFFGFRFYGRYRRQLRHLSQRIMDSLRSALGKVWQEKLDALLDDLNGFREDIRSQMVTVSALKAKGKGEP